MKPPARDPLMISLAILILGWLAAESIALASVLSRLAVLEDRAGIQRPRQAAHEPLPRNQSWAMPQIFPLLAPTPWCTPKDKR
jgi:hypothetical protein